MRQPEKRGTIRLTTIPGQNSFPYRYVYPPGQPGYAQYAAYTTPRSAPQGPAGGAPQGLKYGYPVPSTAMLLVMAHPHTGSPYGGTFMLIPATAAAAAPAPHHAAYQGAPHPAAAAAYQVAPHAAAFNYNVIPQGRVAYAYAIPAAPHYIKPNYANYVAAQQLLYKGPSSQQSLSSHSSYGHGNSEEDESDSAESSTVSTYGSRTRSTEQYLKG